MTHESPERPELAGYTQSIREAETLGEALGLLAEAGDYMELEDLDRLWRVIQEEFRGQCPKPR